MSLKEKLEKIDSEIEKGLKYKASDRLRNLIQENPNETQLWNKLAELYYDSGFLDSAGKWWILTEPTDERIKKCVDIYEKSVNFSGYQILQEITFRGDKKKLSEFARKKLAELESDSKKKTKHIPKFLPRINKQKKKNSDTKKPLNGNFVTLIIFLVLAIILVFIIVGFATVIEWIF